MAELVYPIDEKQAKMFIGEPICAVLHDGTYWVGIVEDVRKGQVFLSGRRGSQSVSKNPRKAKAQISALGLGGLGGLGGFGGLGLGMLSSMFGLRGLGGLFGGRGMGGLGGLFGGRGMGGLGGLFGGRGMGGFGGAERAGGIGGLLGGRGMGGLGSGMGRFPFFF